MATQYTQQYLNPMSDIIQGFTGAIQAEANRPVKTSAYTETMSKPLEFSDMLARRNQIGAERAALNEALKQRETFGYGFANALASMPTQQGAGSWLGDFARGFGSAFNARANAAIDRAKQDYESAQADLATALAFDKAMGNRQIQSELVGYSPVATSNTKNGGAGSVGNGGLTQYTNLPDVKIHELNQAAGRWNTFAYDPTDKEQGWWTRQNVAAMRGSDYGLAKAKGTKQAQEYQKFETVAMQGMFDVLKALRPATDTDVMVALQAAGADPTMAQEVRDLRLTKTLNDELTKAGLPLVKNLQHWDATVDYLRKTGQWSPENALKQTVAEQETNKSSTNNLKLDGVDGWQTSAGGIRFRIKQ